MSSIMEKKEKGKDFLTSDERLEITNKELSEIRKVVMKRLNDLKMVKMILMSNAETSEEKQEIYEYISEQQRQIKHEALIRQIEIFGRFMKNSIESLRP